jgi:hypothetical protein
MQQLLQSDILIVYVVDHVGVQAKILKLGSRLENCLWRSLPNDSIHVVEVPLRPSMAVCKKLEAEESG